MTTTGGKRPDRGAAGLVQRFLKNAELFDTYGALLTEKQRRVMTLSLHEDCSLSEIAAELEISRQGVHDIIRRAAASLAGYEARLGFVSKDAARRGALGEIYDLIEGLSTEEAEARDGILRKLAPFAGREE